MVELWEGPQCFAVQESLPFELEGTSNLCKRQLLYKWRGRVHYHGGFLPWPGDNYQALQHSHCEHWVVNRPIQAADNHSTIWWNGKVQNSFGKCFQTIASAFCSSSFYFFIWHTIVKIQQQKCKLSSKREVARRPNRNYKKLYMRD